jgi:hypothetical protein
MRDACGSITPSGLGATKYGIEYLSGVSPPLALPVMTTRYKAEGWNPMDRRVSETVQVNTRGISNYH